MPKFLKPLYKIVKRIEQLDRGKLMVKAIDERAKLVILDMNRILQLYQGIDVNGNEIGTYSEFTQQMNAGREFDFKGETHEKIQGQHYTFFDTGEFFESFKVVLVKDGFYIQADDQKEDGTLESKFRRKLVGLTDENKIKLANYIRPKMAELAKKELLK